MDMQSMMQTEVQKCVDMEKQLAEGLLFLTGRAQSDDLKEALQEHREETFRHARSLEELAAKQGWTVAGGESATTRALIHETQQLFQGSTPSPLCDALIIGAAQKAEHYEMATYGTLATWADHMDLDDAEDCFGKILSEEKDADKRLSKIAEHKVNKEAVKQSGARML